MSIMSVGQSRQPTFQQGSQLRKFLRKFFRNRLVAVSFIVVLLFVLVAIFAPWIRPEDPYRSNLRQRLVPPSAAYIFGTDQQGRDMLSRVIEGSRIALAVGFVAVGVGLVFGGLLGLVAGYFGGVIDAVIMRVMDIILAFPWLLLVIAIVSILGPNLANAMLAISITVIPQYARLLRSVVLSVRERDFVVAAFALGATHWRLIFIHIVPHCVAQMVVLSTITLGKAILAEAGLSFLGLGVQPPQPSWGSMIAVGQDYLLSHPYLSIVPGAAVMIIVIALNKVGDGLRDALDPKI
jgi:peptide/nickel transport system permease protein